MTKHLLAAGATLADVERGVRVAGSTEMHADPDGVTTTTRSKTTTEQR
jgi:hypothetical protein